MAPEEAAYKSYKLPPDVTQWLIALWVIEIENGMSMNAALDTVDFFSQPVAYITHSAI